MIWWLERSLHLRDMLRRQMYSIRSWPSRFGLVAGEDAVLAQDTLKLLQDDIVAHESLLTQTGPIGKAAIHSKYLIV